MKALVLTGPSRFEYRDVPDPAPAADEVLVRVRACGICGSDVHGMDGSTGRRIPPLIMGHEAAGEIAAGNADWPAGTRVTFDSTLFCGVCPACRAGAVNLCTQRRVIGVSCADYRRDGAFAEYVSVPARTLHRLPDGLDFPAAALAEPVAVALHAARRSARLAPAASVAVVGAGLIGLLLIQALRAQGLERIVAIDLDAARLAAAQRLGASAALDSRAPDFDARLAVQTSGHGFDVVFEVVGLSATVSLAIAAVRRGGDVVLVGNVSPSTELPLQSVVTREISLLGSCASAGEYPAALELLATGRVDASAMISACAPLRDGAEWFAKLHAREPGLLKVVLQP